MKSKLQLNAPAFGDMATFFGVCVWLAPLFLFLSLSANDNALPTAGQGMPSTPTIQPPTPASVGGRTSLFRSLMSTLPRPWTRRASSRRLASDSGIITPSSPINRRTSFGSAPPSPGYAIRPGSPALNDIPRSSYEYDGQGPSRKQSEDGVQPRPSSRRALTRALELARQAVQLDSTNEDPYGAVMAYGKSVALLSTRTWEFCIGLVKEGVLS